jgi:hypothetical protein
MMQVSLAASTCRRSPPAGRALLDLCQALVVLGNRLQADGLPVPVGPAPTTLFGPRVVCFAPSDCPFHVSDTGHHRLRRAERDRLCWPVAIAANGATMAVADTGNNRVLLWHATA